MSDVISKQKLLDYLCEKIMWYNKEPEMFQVESATVEQILHRISSGEFDIKPSGNTGKLPIWGDPAINLSRLMELAKANGRTKAVQDQLDLAVKALEEIRKDALLENYSCICSIAENTISKIKMPKNP